MVAKYGSVDSAGLVSADAALPLMIEAVQEAGKIGQRYARNGAKVFSKADNSPVTEADLAIDAHLAYRLKSFSGAIGWLSEETADDHTRLSVRQVWVVDPIDGTRGFIAGNGEWVISVALVEDGVPVAGVLLRPDTGDLYTAIRGQGASKNGECLTASTGTLKQTATAAGPKPIFDIVQRRLPGIKRQPSLSSLALRLALVAEGGVDTVFASANARDWDLAAAHVILREAGAELTTLTGQPLIYNREVAVHQSLVAAGLERHSALTQLFASQDRLPRC